MTAEQLNQILSGYIAQPLSPPEVEQLLAYLGLLIKWNAKTNLTAIREPEEIVGRHFGESLALASRLTLARGEFRAADLGSGAGFPGIPLAIHAPGAQLTLIESQNKKATFLKEVVRSLGLVNVSVLNQRAEEIALKFEVVTMRAVERFTQALMVASLMLPKGGLLGLLVSANQVAEIKGVLAHKNVKWRESELPGGTRVLIGEI